MHIISNIERTLLNKIIKKMCRVKKEEITRKYFVFLSKDEQIFDTKRYVCMPLCAVMCTVYVYVDKRRYDESGM